MKVKYIDYADAVMYPMRTSASVAEWLERDLEVYRMGNSVEPLL